MAVNLLLMKKRGSPKSFAISKANIVIGRREDCDLCIPLRPVSRRHCELRQLDDKIHVCDLGSSNGTFVNGIKVDEVQVNAGDLIQVGPLTFALQIDGKPENITFSDEPQPTLEDTFFETFSSSDDTMKEN